MGNIKPIGNWYYYRIYDRYGDREIVSLAVVTNQAPAPALETYQRERDG